jgi:hypothetical protein
VLVGEGEVGSGVAGLERHGAPILTESHAGRPLAGAPPSISPWVSERPDRLTSEIRQCHRSRGVAAIEFRCGLLGAGGVG